jgi:hypothetical protein
VIVAGDWARRPIADVRYTGDPAKRAKAMAESLLDRALADASD